MTRYFFLAGFIGFFAISTVKADVCDSSWWEVATVPNLEALTLSEGDFPEFCNVWQDTPLHFGVRTAQNAEVISAFINITRANVLAVNIDEETPLSLAQARLNRANTLLEYAREAHYNAGREVDRSRYSASLRHLRGQLTRAAIEARERRDQALNEQQVAEAIHQIISSP